jgi:hypothetical protein
MMKAQGGREDGLMAALRPRDLLTDDLLGRLGRTGASPGDSVLLAEAGYLKVALPPEFGGLGCTLRQAACGQRRLARHAPDTALAVSAHLYWTGAAADAYRAGDDSVRWILAEARDGALLAGGHQEAGGDLRFADPSSRCESAGPYGYVFHDPRALSTRTPSWDWLAVHAVHQGGPAGAPRSVIAFAGRGGRFAPAFRVVRVCEVGTPADVFTASALTWGHSILASVQYSDARRAFNEAITALAAAVTPAAFVMPAQSAGTQYDGTPHDDTLHDDSTLDDDTAERGPGARRPAGRWAVAEAGALLDAMKARIAEVTHPWQLVQVPAPDVGGQHLIGLHAMRHEVAEGAASVYALVEQLTGTPAPPSPLAS